MRLHKYGAAEPCLLCQLSVVNQTSSPLGLMQVSTRHTNNVCWLVVQAGEVVYVISTLVGLMLWGMGFWWLVHGVTCVAARFFFGGLHFNMGFWYATCCVPPCDTCAQCAKAPRVQRIGQCFAAKGAFAAACFSGRPALLQHTQVAQGKSAGRRACRCGE